MFMSESQLQAFNSPRIKAKDVPAGYQHIEMTKGFYEFVKAVADIVGSCVPQAGCPLLTAMHGCGRVLVMGMSPLEPDRASLVIQKTMPLYQDGTPFSTVITSDTHMQLLVGPAGKFIYRTEPAKLTTENVYNLLSTAFTIDRELRIDMSKLEVYDGFDLGERLIKAECRTLDGLFNPAPTYVQGE